MIPGRLEVRNTTLIFKRIHDDQITMALAKLAEKIAVNDVLRHMVQFMAQQLRDLDVNGRCGAGYDEKISDG